MFYYWGEADFHYLKLNHIFYYSEHNIQWEKWVFPLRQQSRSLPLNARHTHRQQEDYVLLMTTTRTLVNVQIYSVFQQISRVSNGFGKNGRTNSAGSNSCFPLTMHTSTHAYTCFLHPLSQLLFIQRPGKAETNKHKHQYLHSLITADMHSLLHVWLVVVCLLAFCHTSGPKTASQSVGTSSLQTTESSIYPAELWETRHNHATKAQCLNSNVWEP